MNTLIVFAIISYTLMPGGEQGKGIKKVQSVTECAQVINGVLHPIVVGDGRTAYITDAQCMVRSQSK